MAFLPKSEILRRGPYLLSDFEGANTKQASYDLRLGAEWFLVGDDSPRTLSLEEPYLCLHPGQFALLTTFERITMPNELIGFISVRTQYKLQGLVNISGFHIDPSFEGTLQFAVQNLSSSDIRLKFKEATFTAFFCSLEPGDIGKYREPDGDGIRLKHVQMFGGNSVTIASLHKDVDKLRTLLTIYGGIAVAALTALLIKIFVK